MDQNYEEQVSYKQAADIIGVKEGSIRESVSNGKLTRCAYPPRAAYLLKAQVDLFAGKGTTSQRVLSYDQTIEWKKCEKIARTPRDDKKSSNEVNIDDIPMDRLKALAYNTAGATKSWEKGEMGIVEYAHAIIAASCTTISAYQGEVTTINFPLNTKAN